MANRHLSRSVVLQSLFELDYAKRPEDAFEEILIRISKEFAPGMGSVGFALELGRGILERRADLDTIIEKAAPDWPIDKISTVDRNVLRIGLYELLFADRAQVPAKVAINEAIELAKTYGGESSGRFVNGVLGSVYKEIGEPGKDETGKRKGEDIPYEKLPVERLGGAVVYAREGADIYLALVHDIFGHWTLSKGHIDADEDPKAGTARELKEELGVGVEIETELGKNEYVANHPENGKTRKQVLYFLAIAPYVELQLGESGGLDDARWFRLAEVVNLNIYDDILPIVTKAVNLLLKK